MLKNINLTLVLLFFTLGRAFAQTGESLMRSNGKIYVVVGVLLILLFGFFLYLFRLQKRIDQIEDLNK